MAAGIAVALTGCTEQVFDGGYAPALEGHYLSLSPRDFSYTEASETKSTDLKSLDSWKFGETPKWLSVNQTEGNGNAIVTLTSSANTSLSARQAVFFVDSESNGFHLQRALTASQSGETPYVEFKNVSANVETTAIAQTLVYDIDTNLPDLQVSFLENWGTATYNAESKKVSLTLQENRENIYRKGDLYIASPGYNRNARLSLTQHASNISVMESLTFEADGGTETVNVESDLDWTAITEESWIEINPTSGKAGKMSIQVKTLPSYQSTERIGYVYFYFGDKQKKYIAINQQERYLNVSELFLTLDAEDGSSTTINVDSNIGWEITQSPEWLKFDRKSGSVGKSSFKLTATKNNSLNARSGTVKISDDHGGSIAKSITVEQKPFEFNGDTALEFGWQSTAQHIAIEIPTNWVASTIDNWIHLSSYFGDGKVDIDVSVDDNISEEARTGSIIFESEGKQFNVSVVQTGQYINIQNTIGEIGALGGIITLEVDSNLEYSCEIENEKENEKQWVDFEESDSGQFILKVSYNESVNQRSCIFRIKAATEKVSDSLSHGIAFHINQEGRKLNIEKSYIELSPKAGVNQEIVYVDADGPFEIDDIQYGDSTKWFDVSLIQDQRCILISVNEDLYVGTEDLYYRYGEINVKLAETVDEELKTKRILIRQYPLYNLIFVDFDEDKEI